MNNNINSINNQGVTAYLRIPNFLEDFTNTETLLKNECYYFNGFVPLNENDRICPKCHSLMHINNKRLLKLHNINIGSLKSIVSFYKHQLFCPNCKHTQMQKIKFEDEHHHITTNLKNYIIDVLNTGGISLKKIAEFTGINKNIIKDIDKERLLNKYTNNGKKLIIPEPAEFLGIDEFKLHNGFIYATHIVDLSTGKIIWISHGKGNDVVYEFIKFVGKNWMKKVKAVACDMNAGFCNAFKKVFPHIDIVFDHFHIIKNFNEYAVKLIYNDNKNCFDKSNNRMAKYLMMSRKENLKKKDKKNKEKRHKKKSALFKHKRSKNKHRKSLNKKYNGLIKKNEIFILIDIIKEELDALFKATCLKIARKIINAIIQQCEENGNKHLLWFRDLLKNHYEGIVNHAKYPISTGKVEGLNNKIKTLRRIHYGLPDDEYFFLKVIDCSYVK